jgi:F-type H+-transporting ATPase subunit gamma
MSNLKQLRNRLKTIKSTQKITKAMHLVSAAKLQKVKEDAQKLNDYAHHLSEIMYEIAHSDYFNELPPQEKKFFTSVENNALPALFVVMSSERGLCGSFNSNIVKKVKSDMNFFAKHDKKVKLLIIGKKAYDALKDIYSNQIIGYYNVPKNSHNAIAIQLARKIMELVASDAIGSCYMYYNDFKNVLTQVMTVEKILPAESYIERENNYNSIYEYEGAQLASSIIELYLNGEMSYGLLQSMASEEGARMTAMDNATRNAGELANKLTLQLNRSRQAIITTELIEIIAGAEAV